MITVAPPTPPAELRGTPRQIAFAARLRDPFLAEIDEIRDRAAERLRFGILTGRDAEGLQIVVRAADAVRRVDQAAWWIRQDGRYVQSILADVGRRIRATDARP
jgi:hypothetical protein